MEDVGKEESVLAEGLEKRQVRLGKEETGVPSS
jgi:hypothetical protein